MEVLHDGVDLGFAVGAQIVCKVEAHTVLIDRQMQRVPQAPPDHLEGDNGSNIVLEQQILSELRTALSIDYRAIKIKDGDGDGGRLARSPLLGRYGLLCHLPTFLSSNRQ